jgi:hypothetical protein
LLFVSRRLYEEAAVRKIKQQDRAAQMPIGCSFRPTLITANSMASNEWTEHAHTPTKEGRAGGGRPDTPTRLYESAKQRNQKVEEMRRKVEEDRLGQYIASRSRHTLDNFDYMIHLLTD